MRGAGARQQRVNAVDQRRRGTEHLAVRGRECHELADTLRIGTPKRSWDQRRNTRQRGRRRRRGLKQPMEPLGEMRRRIPVRRLFHWLSAHGHEADSAGAVPDVGGLEPIDHMAHGLAPARAGRSALASLRRIGGHAGLILVDPTGRAAAVFNTPRMARGTATERGGLVVRVDRTAQRL